MIQPGDLPGGLSWVAPRWGSRLSCTGWRRRCGTPPRAVIGRCWGTAQVGGYHASGGRSTL